MLHEIFFKSPEQKLLSLFAMNPDRSFYGREISKRLKVSVGAVHAALRSLEKHGLLDSQLVGKTKLYRMDVTNPIIRSLKILNTILFLQPLAETLREVTRQVILFGSYASGRFISSSDIDVFIVSGEREKVLRKIHSFKRKSGLDIRPIIKDQVEWMALDKESPEFYEELGRGITLWEKPIDESGF